MTSLTIILSIVNIVLLIYAASLLIATYMVQRIIKKQLDVIDAQLGEMTKKCGAK